MIGHLVFSAVTLAVSPTSNAACKFMDDDFQVSEVALTIGLDGQPLAISASDYAISEVVPGYTKYPTQKFVDFARNGQKLRLYLNQASKGSDIYVGTVEEPVDPSSLKAIPLAAGICRLQSGAEKNVTSQPKQIRLSDVFRHVRYRDAARRPEFTINFRCSLVDAEFRPRELRLAAQFTNKSLDVLARSKADLLSLDADWFSSGNRSFKGDFAQSLHQARPDDLRPLHTIGVSFLVEDAGSERHLALALVQVGDVLKATVKAYVIDDRSNKATSYAIGLCDPVPVPDVIREFN